MNTAAIASHLNVIESAIVRVEEWAKVLFVVVKGVGARFVSKKVVKVEVFGSQEVIKTPSGGSARYWKGSNRYEVCSHMWSNGGGSIVGYAYNQDQLNDLLEKAERESLASKKNAENKGAVYASVPAGYEVNDLGDLVENSDLIGFDSEPY